MTRARWYKSEDKIYIRLLNIQHLYGIWTSLTPYRLRLDTRLLNTQHLYGIWTGLTPYRLRLDTLSEYPEP